MLGGITFRNKKLWYNANWFERTNEFVVGFTDNTFERNGEWYHIAFAYHVPSARWNIYFYSQNWYSDFIPGITDKYLTRDEALTLEHTFMTVMKDMGVMQ
jgi:hypothetical protein